MANLTINGHSVTVGDEFLKLTPEQQDATVNEIAASLPAPAPEKSTLQTIRESGEKAQKPIARGMLTGAGMIPALAADAAYNAGSGINYLSRKAASALTGDNSVEVPASEAFGMPATRGLQTLVDMATGHMASAESKGGKIASEIAEGAASAMTGAGLGRTLATKGPQALKKVGGFLEAQPVIQTVAGGVSSGVPEIIRQNGGGDGAAAAAGLGSGVATALTLSALSRGKAAPRVNAFKPEGQAALAGEILQKEATDPVAAAAAARAAPEFIPGARPLGTTATADPGLITAGKKLERFAGDTAERELANNIARETAFAKAGLRPGAIERVETRLDDLAENLPKGIFGNEKPVDVSPLITKLEALIDPANQSDQTIEKARLALRWLDTANASHHLADKRIMMPSQLYQKRKQIGLLIKKPTGAEDALSENARGALKRATEEIDDIISSGAPDFETKYLRPYRNAAKNRDQLTYLQTLRDRTTSSGIDGVRQFSPPSYTKLRTDTKRGAPLAKGVTENDLSPKQRNLIDRLDKDMERENFVNARGAKPPNSVTAESIDYGKGIDDAVRSNLPLMARGRLALANGVEGLKTTLGVGGFMGGGAPGAVGGAIAGNVIPRILRGNLEEQVKAAARGVRSELGAAYTDPARMVAGLTAPPINRGYRGARWSDAGRGVYQGFLGTDGGRIDDRKKRGRVR